MLRLKNRISDLLVAHPAVFDKANKLAQVVFGTTPVRQRLRDLCREDKLHFIMQIGANDGIRNDPVRLLLVDFPMRALLVEPDPVAFEQLGHSYSYLKDAGQEIDLLRALCVPTASNDLEFFSLSEEAREGLASTRQAEIVRKASTDRRHLERALAKEGCMDPGSHIEAVPVPTVTLAQLVERYGLPDLLVLDTEGLDWELLNELAGRAGTPNNILFERGRPDENLELSVRKKLARWGYRLEDFSHDVLASR